VAVEIEITGTSDPAIERAAEAALRAAGVGDGHLGIAFVREGEIRRLNRTHRGRDEPTDVLSFPVDGTGPTSGPRELGDVVVCAARSDDPVAAVVHGVLHLCGMDHEADGGEMLALQDRIVDGLR
jgi:probable rRNA maturation factor